MADVYKVLQPAKYLKEFISRNVRPDGRTFDQCKLAVLHPGPISTADGSCMVVLGNTKICCGIKAELTTPSVTNPGAGFVITNLELPSMCSSLFKSGAPSDLAQACNQLIADIFNDSKCIDLQELCINKEKLVWVLYCDMVCINYGGSIIDAAIMALITALKTVKLPKVDYNPTTANCKVNEDIRIPLNILKIPVATSFTLFESNLMLANPTHEEEQQCGGALGGTVIVWGLNVNEKPISDDDAQEEELLQGVHQLGVGPLSQLDLQQAIVLSKNRSYQIRELIHAALKSQTKK